MAPKTKLATAARKKSSKKRRIAVKEEASPAPTKKKRAPPKKPSLAKRVRVKEQVKVEAEDDRDAPVAAKPWPLEATSSSSPRILPAKLSSNRRLRKLGTQIGMPGDDSRIPSGAELSRLLSSDVATTRRLALKHSQSPRAAASHAHAVSHGDTSRPSHITPHSEEERGALINAGVSSPRRRMLGYEPMMLCSSRRPRSSSGGTEGGESAAKRPRTWTEDYAIHHTDTTAGRPIVASFYAHSEIGVNSTNPDKPNQDCFWTLKKFGGDDTQFYFGVADGHGTNGQPAAKLVASQLPQYLHSTLEFPSNIPGAFKRAFKTTDEELRKSMNAKFSGSTVVTCLIRGTKAYGAFVGDSRGIIARRENKAWTVVPLSRDHKPDVPEERARIEANGGRVKPHECDGVPFGPARVWLKTKDGPGLAMSRSFGDSVVARVGVNSEPDIIEVNLKPEDKFFILATDGVWDVISNEEVIDIVAPFCSKGDAEGAVIALIKEANTRYMHDEERTDDTTVVLGLFDVPK
eukprot:GEMP01020252.1.p1 GENE.GEMP01020252.1~~GEMP01020252.1.p1  ORF type:complete len:518 (+),score=136.24 GEMP01020252.1:98-1651(+)